MSFRIESAGLLVNETDRVSHAKTRVVCDACGVTVEGAKSIAHARTIHVCPRATK